MASEVQAHLLDRSVELSAPAVRFFERITSAWSLTVAQKCTLLGGVPLSTYHKYIKRPELARFSRDTLDRISHIVGIYKAINILLPRPEAADSWVQQPNTAFGGEPALKIMLRGGFEDIALVRRYLDGVRQY